MGRLDAQNRLETVVFGYKLAINFAAQTALGAMSGAVKFSPGYDSDRQRDWRAVSGKSGHKATIIGELERILAQFYVNCTIPRRSQRSEYRTESRFTCIFWFMLAMVFGRILERQGKWFANRKNGERRRLDSRFRGNDGVKEGRWDRSQFSIGFGARRLGKRWTADFRSYPLALENRLYLERVLA